MNFLPFLSLSPQLKFEFKWGAYGNLTHSSNEYPSGRIFGIEKAFDWIYYSFVPCVTKVNTCHTCNHSLSSLSLSLLHIIRILVNARGIWWVLDVIMVSYTNFEHWRVFWGVLRLNVPSGNHAWMEKSTFDTWHYSHMQPLTQCHMDDFHLPHTAKYLKWSVKDLTWQFN